MDQNCDECKRVWRAYAAATTEFYSVDKQLQTAAKGNRLETVASLVSKLEALEQAKVAAHEAISQHEKETGHR